MPTGGLPAAALVVAAGSGQRLGAGVSKALVSCAGRPLLAWSLDALRQVAAISQVVVALPAGVDAAGLLPAGVIAVEGGEERSHSVRAALQAVAPDIELVLVHDAARPLVTAAIAEAVLRAAAQPGVDGAVAAAPVSDTIKVAAADGRTVDRTLDRGALWAVQTPQVFRREILERVLAQPAPVLAAATDDASLVEAAGGRVVLVPVPAENLKVTTPLDLELAGRLLAQR